MQIKLPTLREGYEYRRLSVKDGNGKYRFVTIKDIVFEVDEKLPAVKFTNLGRTWSETGRYFLKVSAGYAWNGCSPKKGVRILGKDVWFGTPDFEPTIAASLSHDPPFQFSALYEMPISLEEANANFKSICEQGKFCLTNTYYAALCEFSQKHWGIPDENNDAVIVLLK